MGELYLRKVILDIVPSAGQSKRIEGLRIKFRVEKTSESTPNDAEIEVFNLSDATRSLLEAKNTRVVLAMGYIGLSPGASSVASVFSGAVTEVAHSVGNVFIGDVNKVTHKVETPNIITTVKAADGENKYRNSRLEKGFPPNSNLDAILQDIIAASGLAKGVREGVPTKRYGNGLTLHGLVRDHLDNLTKANDLEWSIQDEALHIYPKMKGTSEVAILVSPDSGLIGSANRTAKGIEFTSLIQPTLRPGRKVQIESRVIKGSFKLRKVVHDGDSYEGDFTSKCEAAR